MGSFTYTTLTTQTETDVGALSNTNPTSEFLTLSSALIDSEATQVNTVATSADLPRLDTGEISDGSIFYVEEDDLLLYAVNYGWVTFDGYLIYKDANTAFTYVASGDSNYYPGLTTFDTNYTYKLLDSSGNPLNVSKLVPNGRPGWPVGLIDTNDKLWMWGPGTYGSLGQNNTTAYSTPVQEITSSTWSDVALGVNGEFTVGIKTDGTLWGWGYNAYGNLGTNNTTCYSSPVQEVSSSTNWSKVAAGTVFTVGIKTDGTLWSWGYNAYGNLGTNNTTYYSSPQQEASSSTNWSKVIAAEQYVLATKTDGTLWAWGQGFYGKLGTNDTICYSSPVQEASSSTNWTELAVTGYSSHALKSDGTCWGWGYSFYGVVSGNFTQHSSPVQENSSSTDWSYISGSRYSAASMMGIKTTGEMWGWGQESGINWPNYGNSSIPAQVVSGTAWTSVALTNQTVWGIQEDNRANR